MCAWLHSKKNVSNTWTALLCNYYTIYCKSNLIDNRFEIIKQGPVTRTWYGILDKHIGSKGGIVVLKKVSCDQLLFAPVFLAVLLSTIGIFQGNSVEELQMKLKNEYLDILKNNYKVMFIGA